MQRERHSIILAFLFLFFGGWCVQGRCDDLESQAAAIAAQSQTRIEEFRGIAETITRQHQRQVENQVRQLVPENDQILPERTIIFITLGETPADNVEKNRQLLKDIKAMAPQAIVAIRGLPAGQRSLEQFARYLKNFQEHGDLPGLRLDPNLFREFQVTVAPTMILERQGQKVAEVRGLVNAAWLKRQVETGRRGDLGQMGPTMQIAERDLIEELQERLMAVDWDAKKKQAYEHYWQKFRFTELPEATQDRRFTLDAKYTVDRDYILPDGKVIARKGDVKDLFKILKPTFALVIFDGSKPQARGLGSRKRPRNTKASCGSSSWRRSSRTWRMAGRRWRNWRSNCTARCTCSMTSSGIDSRSSTFRPWCVRPKAILRLMSSA